MMFATTPPMVSLSSNTVTSTPSLARKNAAAIPAGPPPTTATFKSFLSALFNVGTTLSKAFCAAISLFLLICTSVS